MKRGGTLFQRCPMFCFIWRKVGSIIVFKLSVSCSYYSTYVWSIGFVLFAFGGVWASHESSCNLTRFTLGGGNKPKRKARKATCVCPTHFQSLFVRRKEDTKQKIEEARKWFNFLFLYFSSARGWRPWSCPTPWSQAPLQSRPQMWERAMRTPMSPSPSQSGQTYSVESVSYWYKYQKWYYNWTVRNFFVSCAFF